MRLDKQGQVILDVKSHYKEFGFNFSKGILFSAFQQVSHDDF